MLLLFVAKWSQENWNRDLVVNPGTLCYNELNKRKQDKRREMHGQIVWNRRCERDRQ